VVSGEAAMIVVPAARSETHYDAKAKPAIVVADGATLRFETRNPFGMLFEEGEPYRAVSTSVTGPVYVDGARPNTALRIDVLELIPLEDHGYVLLRVGRGGFGADLRRDVIRRVAFDRTTVHFSKDIAVPARWMIGKIGLAPLGDPVPSSWPMETGGNLDNRLIAPGARVYLPVAVEGALLAIGDCHAAMGDGESALSGVEIDAAVTVRCTVVQNWAYRFPIVVNSSVVAPMGIGANLTEAAEAVLRNTQEILVERAHLNREDAAMLISVAGDLEVCQIVNPRITMRLVLPRQCFGTDFEL
jgi:amidase